MRTIAMLLIDLTIVFVGIVLSLLLRDDFTFDFQRFVAILPYIGFSLASATSAVLIFGQHQAIWRLVSARDYIRAGYVAFATVIGAVALGFLTTRLEGVPRSLPFLQLVLTIALMWGARALTRQWRELRGRLKATHATAPLLELPNSHPTVLLVGLNRVTELYLQGIAEARSRVEIAGILGRNARQVGRRAHNHRILGTPENVVEVLRDLEIEGVSVNCIIVTVPMHKLSQVARDALQRLERETTITIHTLVDLLGLGERAPLQAGRKDGDDADGVEFSAAELSLIADRPYFRVKRALDVVFALSLLLTLAPVFIVAAVLVAANVGFPILFSQRRPGLWGRSFQVYKFRTMSRAYDHLGRRIDDADRSSSIGRFLRRSRLDELPQLYNVLVGEMSFVGPRPLLPIDQSLEYKARLLVRPGITGYAQVNGGRIVDPADKAVLDVWYVKNASLALDVRIAASTIPMMLWGDRIRSDAVERAWRELRLTGICGSWQRSKLAAEEANTLCLDGELCWEMGDDEVRRRRIVVVAETARTSRRSDTPWRRLPPSSLSVRPLRLTIP